MDCSYSGQDISKNRLCQFEEMRHLATTTSGLFRRFIGLFPLVVLSGHFSYWMFWRNYQHIAIRWEKKAQTALTQAMIAFFDLESRNFSDSCL